MKFESRDQALRVLFSCPGVGVINRGIESFFQEAFRGLKGATGVEMKLLTGVNTNEFDEKKIIFLKRTNGAARALGRLTGRTPYAVEQWSSFPSVVREIKTFRPHVIFSSEANLFFLLNRFRSRIGTPYKLLFSNGGPIAPPFNRFDFVHQVAPFYKKIAVDAGEEEQRHIMVPYGIHVPKDDLIISDEEKKLIRRHLNLPEHRNIVISVGWISAIHKRMDYTIREIARISKNERPFLLLLGNIDEASAAIMTLAQQVLEPDDYVIRSVPYDTVSTYYKASDIFVLSSLQEGFGRVFLEALMHNLPVVAHDHPVMRYVIGEEGILENLQEPGNLAKAVSSIIKNGNDFKNRREYVRKKFDWQVLSDSYVEMFLKAAGLTVHGASYV